jgi:hypothetical protein
MLGTHARLFMGLSQGPRDEDRGDDAMGGGGGGGGTGDEGLDAEVAAKNAADKAAAEKAEREKDIKIPKVEFDRRIAAEKAAREAAEARAAKAEKDAAARAGKADVEALEKTLGDLEEELDKALADNNAAEKKRIRAEMRATQEAITDARVEARSSYATALAIEQVRYDNEVARMEAEYPFLVPDEPDAPNPDFNAEIVGSVLDLKAAYEATGMPSSQALKKAMKTLGPQLRDAKAAMKKDDAKGEDDAAADAEKKAKDEIAKAAEEKRKADAVAKGLDAKGKQPPGKVGDAGKADNKVKSLDIKSLSDKDFDKLDEDTLKSMRGD